MAAFKYKARNLNGEVITGVHDAESLDHLKKYLGEKGFFVLEANKQATQITLGSGGKVTVKDLSILCRQFSVILGSGIPVLTAINILKEQTEKVKLKAVLEDVYSELQKGRILSDCMSSHERVFPLFMRNMVKVGEMSGTLEMVLLRLAEFYDRETAIRKKVKAAMTYPLILLVMAIGVVIFLMVGIIPMFSNVLGGMGAEMPGITRFMMSLSTFFIDNLLLIIVVLVASGGGIYYYIQTPSGMMMKDTLMISMPVVKNTTFKVMTSRFARSMSILLRSGIPVVESIDLMSNLLGNKVVESRFSDCRDKVKQGRGLAGPIKEINIFPPLLVHMVAVGEQTGELDEMLEKTSEFFDAEVEESVDTLTAFIQPVMIVFLAVIICAVILSVMLPLTSIMETIQ